jgi:hypothetical protein
LGQLLCQHKKLKGKHSNPKINYIISPNFDQIPEDESLHHCLDTKVFNEDGWHLLKIIIKSQPNCVFECWDNLDLADNYFSEPYHTI